MAEYNDEIRVLQTATSKWFLSMLKHPPDFSTTENEIELPSMTHAAEQRASRPNSGKVGLLPCYCC